MIKTSYTELYEMLTSLKLPKNREYIIHSSLVHFGIIENGCEGVLNCLIDVLGQESTILMPSFTLNYTNSRVWSYNRSKAETGALTEYFRKKKGVERTLHPIHSLAVTGPNTKSYIACNNFSSFGPNNPFEKLINNNGINIGLGIGLVGGATFLHYAEELSKVPYRFMKSFPGKVLDKNENIIDTDFKMFSRNRNQQYYYINNWENVTKDLIDMGLLKVTKLNQGTIIVMDMKTCHELLLTKIYKDPYYLATKINIQRG